ncbi:short-chain dehydrogenase/reductase family 42E member 1-like isoform X1 [Dreissena polymorpha]|nr:short-chain dehydrogenase/reductase family 42E member 1-like isoform X1 [Dreissena polymorpha]XP_052267367.1 short-chain dehydrogenase/reductase family 42E member 1-like isoform X1 [Dreissena polymorpha]
MVKKDANTDGSQKGTRIKVSDPKDQQEVHLVTGGGGFAGSWLGRRLADQGHLVRLIDVCAPVSALKEGMEFNQCDLTDRDAVVKLLRGVDCVYHLASYGMSGREQLNRKRIEAVNVGGTKNVIQGCLENDVTRLVYTSTYNTVFGGQKIENGDESLPYLPLDKHPDHYSRTKSIAEQTVLAADGSPTKGGKILHTCTVRLAAVYGPGETRHIPRIVGNLEAGLLAVTYERASLQDFLHVENLALAHELAGQGLTEEKKYIAAGQAYFISDDKPINTFTFFQPLIEGLGYTMPRLQIPLALVYFVAYLIEWLHFLVSPIYNFQPLLTRTEVYKVGVTHYFSIKKAQCDLGYTPMIQNDMSEVVQFYLKTGRVKRARTSTGLFYWIMNILIMLMFGSLIMSFIPIVK